MALRHMARGAAGRLAIRGGAFQRHQQLDRHRLHLSGRNARGARLGGSSAAVALPRDLASTGDRARLDDRAARWARPVRARIRRLLDCSRMAAQLGLQRLCLGPLLDDAAGPVGSAGARTRAALHRQLCLVGDSGLPCRAAGLACHVAPLAGAGCRRCSADGSRLFSCGARRAGQHSAHARAARSRPRRDQRCVTVRGTVPTDCAAERPAPARPATLGPVARERDPGLSARWLSAALLHANDCGRRSGLCPHPHRPRHRRAQPTADRGGRSRDRDGRGPREGRGRLQRHNLDRPRRSAGRTLRQGASGPLWRIPAAAELARTARAFAAGCRNAGFHPRPRPAELRSRRLWQGGHADLLRDRLLGRGGGPQQPSRLYLQSLQ